MSFASWISAGSIASSSGPRRPPHRHSPPPRPPRPARPAFDDASCPLFSRPTPAAQALVLSRARTVVGEGGPAKNSLPFRWRPRERRWQFTVLHQPRPGSRGPFLARLRSTVSFRPRHFGPAGPARRARRRRWPRPPPTPRSCTCRSRCGRRDGSSPIRICWARPASRCAPSVAHRGPPRPTTASASSPPSTEITTRCRWISPSVTPRGPRIVALGHGQRRRVKLAGANHGLEVSVLLMRVDSPEFRAYMELSPAHRHRDRTAPSDWRQQAGGARARTRTPCAGSWG